MDITYIPMARGFVFSRRVLSWRLSITMEAAFYAAGGERWRSWRSSSTSTSSF